jgi:2-dehydro-3-deoxyphosphogluconate aldolase / (4S)-4-hydroxy-2-oxoglutarate aldolase
MARFSRMAVLNEVVDGGLVPLYYNPDIEIVIKAISAAAAGGAKVFEFTNRGDNAYQLFPDLVKFFEKEEPSLILGVGSVVDPGTASLYLSSGANFIVGSVTNPEVARLCNRRKVPYMPGCGTASEISNAEELGVEIVKIFPGMAVGGPSFVKSVLAPTPWTRIMPTGGVKATKENINEWFAAGVSAVGMGSGLFKKDWISEDNFEAITDLTVKIFNWIKAARGQSVFMGVEHVGLYPTDKAGAEEIGQWYRDVFGLALKEGNSAFFVSGEGSGRIEIVKKTSPVGCHVCIEVSDFEAAVEHLAVKGIELEEPKIRPATKAVFLKQADPAGNTVHILWRK